MSRYIDADALYKVVTERYSDITAGSYPYNYVAFDMANLVKKAPTADVVEVVRCKDCVFRLQDDVCGRYYCELDDSYVGETDYCSRGERREQ